MKKFYLNFAAFACLGVVASAATVEPASADALTRLTPANEPAPVAEASPGGYLPPVLAGPRPSPGSVLLPLTVTPAALSGKAPLSALNLARWSFGAALIIEQPGGGFKRLSFSERGESPFSPLMMDDVTIGAPFPAGETNLILDLAAINTVTHLSLFSFTAAGSVEVYYAPKVATPLGASDSRWTSSHVRQTFAANQAISLQLQPLDTQFVLLKFQITQPGALAALAIFASNAMLAKAMAPEQFNSDGTPKAIPPNASLVDFDFGPSIYGSRVTHIAGGPVSTAQLAIDGDPSTGVQLGQDDVEDNILVVDLGETREVNKFGMLFGARGPGKLEVYMLNSLPPGLEVTPTGEGDAPAAAPAGAPAPESAPSGPGNTPPAAANDLPVTSWLQADGARTPLLLAAAPGSLAEFLLFYHLAQAANEVQTGTLSTEFFENNQPSLVNDIVGNEERVSMRFDKLPCRYLLVRWVPNDPADRGMEVFELSLMGEVPEDEYLGVQETVELQQPDTAQTPPADNPPEDTTDQGETNAGEPTEGENVDTPPPTSP